MTLLVKTIKNHHAFLSFVIVNIGWSFWAPVQCSVGDVAVSLFLRYFNTGCCPVLSCDINYAKATHSKLCQAV